MRYESLNFQDSQYPQRSSMLYSCI